MCISVGETLQKDWLYKLSLLVTNKPESVIAKKYGKVTQGILDGSEALKTNLCLDQGRDFSSTL